MAAKACRNLVLSWLFHVWLLAWAVSAVYGPIGSFAQQLRPNTSLANQTEEGTICTSVDIRNTINTFEMLRGCTVVEGFVKILLFDNVNKSQFENISFPELREITDYLLLYRVNGLQSLGKLFPNLSVIRGQSLLFGFAFIVFEMSSLQEINLHSLTDITQGLIRIDKNPSLCFVNSIDWTRIVHEKGEHFIRSLKSENECPLCPGDDGSSINACPLASPTPGVTDHLEGRHLCWNQDHCQRICPRHCKACNDRGDCCDEKCLGRCSNNNRKKCHVCTNFTMSIGYERKCTTQCPPTLYEYLGRRCVTKEQCVKFTKVVEPNMQRVPYKVYANKCIPTCPPNYMENPTRQACIPCEGKCKKKCPGINVDNLASAQQLLGCTHINGSLEIQIRGGRNIVNELEENLNMIEEIDGYIKVVRSFPLMSLNFLKNLRIIHGNILENQKYVFVVLDNQNLQDIWDWTNRTLKIARGRLFFHFNPKLCLDKIKKLQVNARLSNFTDLEVASNSNGDKTACNVQELDVRVGVRRSIAVSLEWTTFQMHDPRKLLAYMIYSKEAPYRNVTLYDNRDACGGDGWRVKDVQIPDDNSTKVTYLLPNLKPYTQYAFYVKTYTIATEQSGAQSKIQYFWTKPDKPSIPVNVQVSSNNSDSLLIKWSPPNTPNGNITYYSVTGTEHKVDSSSDGRTNYCISPLTNKPTSVPDVTSALPKLKSNDTCECGDGSKSTGPKNMEGERISQISFEDELLNRVYIKKGGETESNRKKRQLFENGGQENHVNNTGKNITVRNITSNETQTFVTFNFTVQGTELYINKLKHFTDYNIRIQACRNKEIDDEEEECSEPLSKSARTKKKFDADNILGGINVTYQNMSTVIVSWDEPPLPNGKILTYQIEYKRVDIANSMPTSQCDNAYAFVKNGRRYTISNLNSGNWSFRVKAVSQAGEGEFTSYVYVYIKEPSGSPTNIVLGILVALLVIGAIAGFFVKKRCDNNNDNKLIKDVNPEYVVYVPDEWEVERSKIELREELGQGSFGMVYEGIARDIKGKAQIRCAIKTVNIHATDRERVEFLNEASVMKAFDTTHVVKLLGVVSKGQPTLVVMELMANGDLKSYLRSHRPGSDRQPPTLKHILQMAIEIADGMAYLSAKKFVHRDLAARNCMVSEDLTVKIGDFGMTRDIYETDYYRKGTKGLLPVRWMAPESLKDGVFTSSSDVWSYGIVLWEMTTLASQPYQGLSNDQVLRYVIDGGIMERPDNCPDKLYSLMKSCWNHKSSERPTFLELCTLLLEDASEVFSKVSFYHSAAGLEARSSRNNQSTSQDDNSSTPLRIAHEMKDHYSLSSSDADSDGDDDLDSDAHLEFSSYPIPKDSSTTINGYLGANPSNGTMAK